MADYIDGIKIADMEEMTEVEDNVLFIGEDSEDTKKVTFENLIKAFPGMRYIEVYFGVSGDPNNYPSQDEETTAILGNAVVGKTVLGDSGTWTKEAPTHLADDEYLWVRLLITYYDDTVVWSEPWCVTDETAKTAINDLRDEVKKIEDMLHPVGSVYVSVDSTPPDELFGGEWKQVDVTFLLASGDDNLYIWKRVF